MLSDLDYNDPRIGTIDLETYKDGNIPKVYALGFYTKLDAQAVIFYIDKGKAKNRSHRLLLQCFDRILTDKYTRHTWYIHNFGGFDASFIIKVLIDYNKSQKDDVYLIKVTHRKDKLLRLYVSKKIGKNTYTITIVDSYNILSHSLDKLCSTFNSEVTKGIFPYKFMTNKALFYVGVKPSIDYWDIDENVNKDSFVVYNEIPGDNWNAKDFTIKYLEKDLISLYNVINSLSGKSLYEFNVCH